MKVLQCKMKRFSSKISIRKEAQLDVIIHFHHLFDSLKETIANKKTNNTSFKSPEPQLPAARKRHYNVGVSATFHVFSSNDGQ